MKPSPDTAFLRTCFAALLSLPLLAGAEPRLTLSPVGCDSLLLVAECDGMHSVQINRDGLFQPLPVRPDSAGQIAMLLPQPGWGERVEFRLAGEYNGLPYYSRDWSWQRDWPELNLQQHDSLLSWKIPACAPDRIWMRIEETGRLRDLRIVSVSTGQLLLDFPWSRLGLSWEQCDNVNWIGEQLDPSTLPEDVTVCRDTPALPALPVILASTDHSLNLRIADGCEPAVLAGDANWHWRSKERAEAEIEFLGGGEILVASRNEEGLVGLPLVWQAPEQELRVTVERLSPGKLQIRYAGGLSKGAELHWLAEDGRSGVVALSSANETLEQLPAMRLHLQLLGEDQADALWTGVVEAGWQAPPELVRQSSSDTSLTFALPPQTPWADGIEVEVVNARHRRVFGPARSVVIQPSAEVAYLDFRWRTVLGMEHSSWSPWRSLGISAHALVQPKAEDAPKGVQLSWATQDPWLMDQVDVIRIVDGDSTMMRATWSEGELLDRSAPAQQQVAYLMRNRCEHSTGEWQGTFVVQTSADGSGWVQIDGVAVSPVELSVAEYLSYSRSTGQPLPPNPPLEGYKDWLSHSARPLVNVSPREVAAYCNWLSERYGLPLMYAQDGTPRPIRGGFRAPTFEEMQHWMGSSTASNELVDVFPVTLPADSLYHIADNVRELCWSQAGWKAPGASWVRDTHGDRSLHVDERLPDAGFRLVLDKAGD